MVVRSLKKKNSTCKELITSLDYITLQSMHHSPTKTNAATASSECSQYWPRQPVAAGRCLPQPQQQPASRPAGHIIMYSNNESMHDTFLKGVPKYNQTQISILMATKQGENIQFQWFWCTQYSPISYLSMFWPSAAF